MLAGNTQPGLRVTKGRYQLSDFVREYRGPKMVPTNKGGVDHVMPIAPLRGSLADEVEATLKAMVAA